ncbi:MAG: MarR family transcriptional regulator [Chloroflexi bacterium]|nr:MarR family transcriptional regulator [Chloroflexota bacterium]
MRAINRAAVLNTIRANDGISRTEVARVTGLSPATVTAITAELIEDGLIFEKEPGAGDDRFCWRSIPTAVMSSALSSPRNMSSAPLPIWKRRCWRSKRGISKTSVWTQPLMPLSPSSIPWSRKQELLGTSCWAWVWVWPVSSMPAKAPCAIRPSSAGEMCPWPGC